MANPFKNFMIQLFEGESVYQEGEAGMMMYVIQSGAVELYREVEGQRLSFGVLEKGDFFGEMCLLLERQARTTSAVVVEDANLVEIDATLFDKMIRGNIEIAVRMMRKLSLRLREREQESEHLTAAAPPAVEQAAVSSGAEAGELPPEVEIPAAAPPPPVAAGSAPPSSTAIPPAASLPAEIPVAPEPPRPSPRPVQAAPAPARSLEQVRQQAPDAHAVFATVDGSQHFPFVGDEAAIGRFDPVTGMRPEVDVSAIDINRSVSRHHARITRAGTAYTLTEEVGALNGTFINEQPLVTGEPSPLQDGDEMGVGVVRLRFHVFG